MKKKHHSCVLAYGQSATGKTHTMMGYPHDPGLTPKFSQTIPGYIQEEEISKRRTTISYLEVYNEKVRDLLSSEYGSEKYSGVLRIREHPKKGPYVQGLTEHEVHKQEELLNWIQLGSQNRRVGSNVRNPHSSRSHAVVTITCDGVRLYLVDLAGSEKTGSKIWASSCIREGANINKSLVALGNVISALAEQPQRIKSNRKRFIPYRDSVLTWLLKDTLGGNSNTVMIATISPASGCFSETVNTLRFGQRAKLIICNPVVIEDPKEKIIRELRLEVAKLRKELEESKQIELPSLMPNSEHYPRTHKKSVLSPTFEKLEIQRATNREDNTSNKPQLQKNTDKLIFVMNVETSVNPEKKTIPKLRRTSSVNSVAMNRSRTPSFGSRESMIESPTSSKSNLSSSSKMSSYNLIRRRSIDKSNALMKRNAPETSKRFLEKSVETDGLKVPIRSKTSHIKTSPVNKSNIIANVTKRLYAKTKNSETDMEGFDEPPKNDIPKELAICSNARIKLRELTQKAIRAHRFKQVETQTDTVVLRVKEVATDVVDLRMYIPEVKEQEITATPEMKDAFVDCSKVDNFGTNDRNDLFKMTKSVGIQCIQDSPTVKNTHFPPVVSFTKFLVNQIIPRQTITVNSSPSIAQETVRNQNVDDEKDEQNRLSFPDLISNHNSLDLTLHSTQIEEPTQKTRFGVDKTEHVLYDSLEVSEVNGPKIESANCFITVSVEEKIPVDGARCASNSVYEHFFTCDFIPPTQLEFSKAVTVQISDSVRSDSLTIFDPNVFEDCTGDPEGSSGEKHGTLTSRSTIEVKDDFKTIDDENLSSPRNKKKENVLEAMSLFLEEATKLMTNLTRASETFGSTREEFEVHITSENDLRDVFGYEQNAKREFVTSYESSSQTSQVEATSRCTQCESYDVPLNHLDPILKDACKKLELSTTKGTTRRLNSSKDSAISFSSTVSELYRDLSLESSNSSPSDYGSLNYKKDRSRCSPSALLKQLSLMRKHVLKSSKECLLHNGSFREADVF